MAKFPDEPAFGGTTAIAPESESARDAQLAQDAAPALALETARAESHYLVRKKELRDALAGETGGGLTEKYAPLFRQAHDDSAALISDPRQREWWAHERAGDVDGELAAVSDWSRTLARDSEIAGAAAQLDALRQSALDTADPAARTPFIEAAGGLIAGLHAAGHIGEPDAKERQKAWAEDFALAAFARLPAAERVRLLGESPDGESGQGGLAGFIPAARRESLLRSTQLDLRNDELAAQSAAALAKYRAESRIRDDLVSMLKTGKGADDLAADDVQAALGPDAARRWREAREDYRLIHDHSHDLHALTESAIDARLRALKPEDEGAEPRKAAVFHAVQEQAGELRQMRLADPARSVAGDPLVRAAQERAQSGDEGARRALHAARLAAQERAGIAPDAQSPITKNEALTLVAPLRGVEAGQERDVLRRLGEDFVARFGSDAERTLAFALRALKSDAQDIAAAKQMLNAVEPHEGIVPGDPQSPNATVAPDSAAADSATAESDTQSGLPSAIAPETLAENSETPLPFTDDPLFGWNTIGSQTRERDGFEVTLAGLMAASGGGKRKAIEKAIDFLRGALFPPPPPQPGKEPPRNEPPPDITPLIPNERRQRAEPDAPVHEDPVVPDRSIAADAPSSVPQHVLDILLPGGKPPPSVRPGWRRRDWEWPGDHEEAEKIFNGLTETATPYVPGTQYRGKMYKLPNGGTIGLRLESRSGPSTIDIDIPGLQQIRKLKFIGK